MTKNTTLIWVAILGVAVIIGSYGWACVLSFSAMAAIAALTLQRRQAIAAIGATWVMNQIVGFALLGYAHETSTYAWGAFIGVGLFAALFAGLAVRGNALMSLRTPTTLVAAFTAYQAVMFAGASALDGFESSTPAIVLDIAKNDALWFTALLAIWTLLTRAAPRLFPARPAAA